MGEQERYMVGVGGAALLYRGLKRGDWLGIAAVAAGSGLLLDYQASVIGFAAPGQSAV